MRILIVTTAKPGSLQGNRVTARRWARILRELGHDVHMAGAYEGQRCDILVALHARKSAASVERFRSERPRSPLILAMVGTDLYRDIRINRAARRSMELASRLILLQFSGLSALPSRLAHKARVIFQSASVPSGCAAPLENVFEVCVIGHLLPVKDPFRAAQAARLLPDSSRVQVVHVGEAVSAAMQRRAEWETQCNPRYRWLGQLPPRQAQRRLARARVAVHSSIIEGGANVLSEAIAAGVPVLASRISASIGLLGEEYPGYFEVGDTRGLSQLMLRAEQDGEFYRELVERCKSRSPLVDPEREKRSWYDLLGEFLWEACGSHGSA